MFAEADVENALKERLAGAAGIPSVVNWPNHPPSNSRPRLDVMFAGGDRSDRTLPAASVWSRGLMNVNVVVDTGVSTYDANSYAEAVASAFPAGLRLTVPGGVVVIDRPPSVRKGYVDSEISGWVTPVGISYLAVSG